MSKHRLRSELWLRRVGLHVYMIARMFYSGMLKFVCNLQIAATSCMQDG